MANLSNFNQRQTFNTAPDPKNTIYSRHLRARNCAFAPFRVVYVPQVALKESGLNFDCVQISDLIGAVASVWNVSVRDLVGPRQYRKIALPRQVVMHLARQHCNQLSLPQIGRALGGRDHTTIMYGSRKIEDQIKRDSKLAAQIQVVKVLLGIEP